MKHTNRPLFITVYRTNPDPPLVGQRHVCIELGWIRGELSHRSPHSLAHGSPPSWSRWLHSVRIAGGGDAKVIERQCLAVLPVGVVIFRDDTRLFPSSAHAPGLCHASARYADQFEGPVRMLLVKGGGRYRGFV